MNLLNHDGQKFVLGQLKTEWIPFVSMVARNNQQFIICKLLLIIIIILK